MDNLKKLTDLLDSVIDTCGNVENLAKILISEGVTVQKWIPVTERLPTAEDAVDGHVYAFLKDVKTGGVWPYEGVRVTPDWFTHWMPLPEPPKEVSA